MSKLKCICGYTIVDQSANLAYKGYIIPDSKVDQITDAFSSAIDSLAEAKELNKKMDWISNNFDYKYYPTDLEDSKMINDLISPTILNSVQDIFECESCGRIAIQNAKTNNFKFYFPESKDTKDILNANK